MPRARMPRANVQRSDRAPAPLVAAPRKQAIAQVATFRIARTEIRAAQPRSAASVAPRSHTVAVAVRAAALPKLGVAQPCVTESVAPRSRTVAIRTAAKPTLRAAQPHAVQPRRERGTPESHGREPCSCAADDGNVQGRPARRGPDTHTHGAPSETNSSVSCGGKHDLRDLGAHSGRNVCEHKCFFLLFFVPPGCQPRAVQLQL
jgi:hypothetical protein